MHKVVDPNGPTPEAGEDKDGGRYSIRTYDFHRVKMQLLSFTTI